MGEVNKFKKAAENFISKGLSVIPTDAHKRPLLEWYKFQKELIDVKHFDDAEGIAIIAGKISGNLEVIDIDCKYDLSGTLFEDFIARIPVELYNKLVIATTKNSGYHIIYRCAEIAGNKKLAQRATTEEERGDNHKDAIRVLIETRGEGGYIVAFPSAGYGFYKKGAIQEISVEDRMLLMDVAGSFNQVFNEVTLYEQFNAEKENRYLVSPFDDFNERGDLLSVLRGAGWSVVSKHGEKVRILRPGKTDSQSSGNYDAAKNVVHIFSTSSVLEGSKSYNAATIFCLFNCAGDWKKAYKELIKMGYGRSLDMTKEIETYIETLKHSTILNLLKERFPQGEIVGKQFVYENKKFKI